MNKIIVLVAAILLLYSCNYKNKKASLSELERPVSEIADFKTEYTADTTTQIQEEGENKNDKQPRTGKEQKTSNPDWDKKIIKTGSVNIEVSDYNKSYPVLRQKVTSAGGYIAQEEQIKTDYKIENTLVIKVPVDQFDNALIQLSDGALKVNERRITSQDVTTEYVDTKSRLESKKQVRLKYLELLKQAKNMEEILNVQSEINSIQEEIESAAGRIEYLSHSAAYSTINLTCYQVLDETAKDNEKKTFGLKIKEAFASGTAWISDLFIGLISIWPLFLAAFCAWIIYKRLKYTPVKKST